MITATISCIPYPGCECVLWEARGLASTAWNKAVSSFDGMYPVASSWDDLLLANIEESTQVALEEDPRGFIRVRSTEGTQIRSRGYDPER